MRLPTYALFVLPTELTAINIATEEKVTIPFKPNVVTYGEIIDAAAYELALAEHLKSFFATSGSCTIFLHESFAFLEVAPKPLRNFLRLELFNLAAYAPISEDKLAFTGYTDIDAKVRRIVFLSTTVILPLVGILKKARCEVEAVLPLDFLQLSSGNLKGALVALSYKIDDGDNAIRFAHNVESELIIVPLDPKVAKVEKRKYVLLISVAVVFILAAVLYAVLAGKGKGISPDVKSVQDTAGS